MKKMTKLLSVILAFVMALSCMTMMASAAKASYKTVDDLTANAAYSPYGTVTRLSTEERMSILFDYLDIVLGQANINMGTVLDTMGITITLDFRSIDSICSSLDTLKTSTGKTMFSIAKGLVDLGIVEDLKMNNWVNGMSRTGTPQMTIVNTLLNLLKGNTSLLNTVFSEGIKLGLIANFLTNVDISTINNLVKDLPSAIKSIVYPLFSRQDDTEAQRNKYVNKSDDIITAAQNFVNGLFTKPMNWTSYREDAAGNDLGYTQTLPTEADKTTRYFVKNADGSITQWDYQYAGILGDPKPGYKETVTYDKSTTPETEGSNVYLYKARETEGYTGDATLKWYKSSNPDANGRQQSPYWLPSVKAAFDSGALTLNINGDDTLLGLLYKFIPYIFNEMAPTVLNGSVKYELAKAFGVQFEYIGKKGTSELAAAITGVNGGDFFTKGQEFYVWEYSDYKVIDGVPYYRFQNDYYKGSLPKDLSSYYYMFNWDWKIGGDFFNEFIPTTVGSSWIHDNLSAVVEKVLDTVLVDSWTSRGTTYKTSEVFAFTDRNGDGAVNNADLLENLMAAAREFFKIAPEEVLDDYYKDAQFFKPMMEGTLSQAANGLVCELVKLIMPQIKFPDNIVDQPITAIAALVVRELCTQLMPKYNFDAMIYANYGDASNKTRAIASHTADEWLDITLYMGVNLGMFYLRNIADLGEDVETGYFTVMQNLGALPALSGSGTDRADAITFGANAYKANGGVASWMVAVDWIIDWALDANTEWCWHFERFVNVDGTVDLATYQNPFNKINSVLLTFIPELENLINLDAFAGNDYGSGTWLEKLLKDGLVDSIVNLDVTSLLGVLKIKDTSVFRRDHIADAVVQVVVNILNKATLKVCGGANLINTSQINSVSGLMNQTNIANFVVSLVDKLYAASATYNMLDPVLPIIGFFAGWTTDPQKYADPGIYFTNSWGSSYLKSDNTPVLKFVNTSSGMLLKHRNSSVVDTAYTITVNSITLDGGATTTASFPQTVVPGQTIDIPLTVPASETVIKATVKYSYTGKDGQALGGEQTKVMYAYVSEVNDQMNEKVAATDSGYCTSNEYKSYEFTKDIYRAVTEYGATITYKSGGVVKPKTITMQSIYTNTESGHEGAPKAPASDYFQHITSLSESGFETITVGSKESTSGKLFKAKAGVTADTEFPYGIYDMGEISIKTKSNGSFGHVSETKAKDYKVDFVYYNDYNIGKIRDQYVGYGLQAEWFTDTAKWEAYETALKNVVKLTDIAKRTDYVTTVQPQIEPAIEALETAYKALMGGYTMPSSGDVSKIEAALNAVETNPDRDLNFQDYKLFEYFQYEKQRTAARNMIAATKGPEAPQNYIENGVSGNALIEAIVDAQANANVKAGINATVVTTSDPEREDEMKAYNEALAAFKPAVYTDLQVDDQAAKVDYYAKFMKANPKGNIDKTFLNQEIAYAEAQNYNQADYSTDSWARYTEALAKAKDVAANSQQESLVFDAKYELMVAQNKLEKHSMKDSGYLNEELIPLIEHANAIIDNYGTLYTVKSGVAYADAFAQLVRALGVKYDVTIDGKKYDGILYDRSALTFVEYDRNDSAKNKRAVDAISDKLRAAIENFECTVKLDGVAGESTVDQAIRYIEGIAPNTIETVDQILSKVTVIGDATPVTQASKSGHYGTGTRIDLKNGDVLLATYFVIIKGDVNGDGAVDAFDAIAVDLADKTAYYMGDVYDDAADDDGNGIIDATDYAAVKAMVTCAK